MKFKKRTMSGENSYYKVMRFSLDGDYIDTVRYSVGWCKRNNLSYDSINGNIRKYNK